ncbi:hypothetical protein F5I97DRAFT_2075888 [Phlebopus sp. FC_14]|nr:hypothetical protein F5I97DRAFT_2075888 [Phlebopus sp. FC_14]
MNNGSTASLLSSTSTLAPPPSHAHAQKDYFAAFADLQSSYGMGAFVRGTCGAGVPLLPPAPSEGAGASEKRWYRANKSPSPSPSSPSHSPPHHGTYTPPPPPRSNKQGQYETALGALMERYGHGHAGGAFGYVVSDDGLRSLERRVFASGSRRHSNLSELRRFPTSTYINTHCGNDSILMSAAARPSIPHPLIPFTPSINGAVESACENNFILEDPARSK